MVTIVCRRKGGLSKDFFKYISVLNEYEQRKSQRKRGKNGTRSYRWGTEYIKTRDNSLATGNERQEFDEKRIKVTMD